MGKNKKEKQGAKTAQKEKSTPEVVFSEEELKKIHRYAILTLIRIGVKSDQQGFDFLSIAVEEGIKNPKMLCKYRKVLETVRRIADAKNIDVVEASINNSIDYTQSVRTFKLVNVLYDNQVLDTKQRPPASLLIRLLVEYYNLGLYDKHKDDYLWKKCCAARKHAGRKTEQRKKSA